MYDQVEFGLRILDRMKSGVSYNEIFFKSSRFNQIVLLRIERYLLAEYSRWQSQLMCLQARGRRLLDESYQFPIDLTPHLVILRQAEFLYQLNHRHGRYTEKNRIPLFGGKSLF